MKLHLFLIILLALGGLSSVTADEARFFPRKGTHFGVYYYPEQWSEEQWERDIKRVAELGFDFIHYGEFAWARLEPEEGKFEFAWMDKAVKLAADNGLKVLISTPSPCPPAWLATRHPEILKVDGNGNRTHHSGSRLTGSLANPVYQEHVARIATKVAERYAKDDRVWGWQISNEPHIQGGEDYSPSAQAAFRNVVSPPEGSWCGAISPDAAGGDCWGHSALHCECGVTVRIAECCCLSIAGICFWGGVPEGVVEEIGEGRGFYEGGSGRDSFVSKGTKRENREGRICAASRSARGPERGIRRLASVIIGEELALRLSLRRGEDTGGGADGDFLVAGVGFAGGGADGGE